MPASDEATRRFKRQLDVYRIHTAAALVASWDRLQAIDESNVAGYEKANAAAVAGAKVAAVSLSAAFFALALGIRPIGIRARDVPVDADLRAPFLAAWHALKMGRPYEEALLAGRSTSEAVGLDFVQSAARRTGDVVAEASGRSVRWRRVPDGNACDWCRLVATKTYLSAESADFGHSRDGCTVVPA